MFLTKVGLVGEWFGEILAAVILGLFGAYTAGLVWGLRLEGLVKQNMKDIDRMEADHKTLVQKHEGLSKELMDKISDVVQSLARIEEKLKIQNKEA